MKVGIIATDEKVIKVLQKVVTNYSLKKLFEAETEIFSDPKIFLNSPDIFDILFVDDCAKAHQTFNLIRQIRSAKPTLTIVMLSANQDYVYEAFPLKVYRFIPKPFSEIMIYEALDSYRREQLSGGHIIAKVDKKFCTFDFQDILYVAAEDKATNIHTRTETVSTNTYFPGIEEQLPEEFFFTCYRSISVNMLYIQEFTTTQILLTNGVSLPLSKRRKMDFFLAYNEFLRTHSFN